MNVSPGWQTAADLTLFSRVCGSPERTGDCAGLSCSPAGRQGTCIRSSSDEVSQNLSRC